MPWNQSAQRLNTKVWGQRSYCMAVAVASLRYCSQVIWSWWGSALEVLQQQLFQANRQGLRSLMGGIPTGGVVRPPALEQSVQVESFKWMLIAPLP
jgi:hypothetical protein